MSKMTEKEYAESLSMETIESMVMGFTDCETEDGCMVEPDGTCPHGQKSPLLILGMI
jgi:hypothetical protein